MTNRPATNRAARRLGVDLVVQAAEREVDVRVSTLPTSFGEKVVMRLFDKSSFSRQVSNLGLDGDLGPVYGVQWRSWPTPDGGHVDQIAEVVRQLDHRSARDADE